MVQSDFVASVYEDGTWCLRALAPRGNEKRKAGDVTYPAKKRKSSKRKSTSEHRKCLDAASHPEVKPGSHKLVVGELVISVSQTTGLEDQTTAKASTSEGRKKRTRSSGGTLAQPQARRAVRSSAKPWIRVECTSICDDDIHSGVQFSHIQQPQPGTTSTFSDSYSICTTSIPNRSIPLASVCSGTRRSSRSTPGRRSSLPGTIWLTKSRTSSLEERQEGFHQVISSESLGDYEQLTQEPEDYLCQECDDQERLEVAKLVSPTEDDVCSEDKRSDPHQHEHELLGLEPLELHQTQLGKRSRRKALLIAITYNSQKWNDPTSKSMQLKGTFGDALDVYSLLLEQGYRPEEIRLMTDEPSQPQTCNDDLPTRRNIERALEELIRDAQPGDQFFLYFAGHGKQVDDISGDEYDGKDEGIIPCDWTTGYNYADEGIIIDDYMRATCINPLPEGCQLIALFDCCHSGTILDLPKEYPPPNRRVMFNPKHVHEKVRARVICFAACKDPEEAQERQGRGLATQAFTKCIRSSCNTAARRWYEEPVAYNPTIGDLFNYMRSSLCTQNGKQIQYPLLTSSFEMIGKELDKRIKI